MRIAPFAFYDKYTRDDVRKFSILTHNSDEAYIGALAIFLLLRQLINIKTLDYKLILNNIIVELPDTNVRQRIIEINENHFYKPISEIAILGNNGYVVNSIPFAIFSALKLNELGFEKVISEITESGGDTDTNASIAGQIMGTILGCNDLPKNLMNKVKKVKSYYKIENIINDIGQN